jgi:hypothetical protein
LGVFPSTAILSTPSLRQAGLLVLEWLFESLLLNLEEGGGKEEHSSGRALMTNSFSN